jgi:hypothetical protein
VQAYHAADAQAMSAEAIALLWADPGRLPAARFTLHPSLRIMESRHAVVSLWAAHQREDVYSALAAVDTALPESALLLRAGLEVEIFRITAGTATFIRHLEEGRGHDAAFDMAEALGLLIRAGAISGIAHPQGGQT